MDRMTAVEPRRVIPALGPVYDRLSEYSYPIVRFAAGFMLIPHGWGKLISGGLPGTTAAFAKMGLEPAGLLAAWVGVIELIGGFCIAVGLLTRFWAGQVVVFMAMAAFVAHWANGFFWTNRGYEYPLFWGLVALAILIRGGGPLSVDRAIVKEL